MCSWNNSVELVMKSTSASTSKVCPLHASLSSSLTPPLRPLLISSYSLNQPCLLTHPLISYSFTLLSLLPNSAVAPIPPPRVWNRLPFVTFVLLLSASPRLPYLPVITHLALTLSAFYLNLNRVSSRLRYFRRKQTDRWSNSCILLQKYYPQVTHRGELSNFLSGIPKTRLDEIVTWDTRVFLWHWLPRGGEADNPQGSCVLFAKVV